MPKREICCTGINLVLRVGSLRSKHGGIVGLPPVFNQVLTAICGLTLLLVLALLRGLPSGSIFSPPVRTNRSKFQFRQVCL